MNKRIIYTNSEGGLSIVIPAPDCGLTIEEIAAKDCPPNTTYEIVDASAIPSDRTFRNAWCPCAVNKVRVDISKAKGIAHDKRRAKRAEEFAPLDVEATIPAKATQAEAARQAVRDKYAAIQQDIDSATGVETLKTIVENL